MVAYLFPGQGRDHSQLQTDIFHASIDLYRTKFDIGKSRVMVGGLSLGEFGALCAAEVLSDKVCLDLLTKRQILMDRVCADRSGSMAAILGMDAIRLEEICQNVGRVVIANFNSPRQLIISGESDAVAEVIAKVIQSQVRVIKLNVAGAFHSPLMDKAAAEFSNILGQVTFAEPTVPFYSSVNGGRVRKGKIIKDLLCRQMNSPVLFERTVRNMQKDGATDFVEVGTASVITKLLPDIIGHGAGF